MCEADVNLSARPGSSSSRSRCVILWWNDRRGPNKSTQWNINQRLKSGQKSHTTCDLFSSHLASESQPSWTTVGECAKAKEKKQTDECSSSAHIAQITCHKAKLSLLATINFCIYCEMKFSTRTNRKILKLKDLFVEHALCNVWRSLDVRGAQEKTCRRFYVVSVSQANFNIPSNQVSRINNLIFHKNCLPRTRCLDIYFNRSQSRCCALLHIVQLQ